MFAHMKVVPSTFMPCIISAITLGANTRTLTNVRTCYRVAIIPLGLEGACKSTRLIIAHLSQACQTSKVSVEITVDITIVLAIVLFSDGGVGVAVNMIGDDAITSYLPSYQHSVQR